MLRKFLKQIEMDIKCMGPNFFPPLIIVFASGAFLVALNNAKSLNDTTALFVLQGLWAVMGSWYSILLLDPILSEKGGELFFTFPTSKFSYGFFKAIKAWLFFIFFSAIVLFLICHSIAISFVSLFLQFLSQSFFFSGFGFLSMVLVKNVNFSLVVIIGYALFCLLLRNYAPPIINVFVLEDTFLSFERIVNEVLIKSILLGSICFGFGQDVFSTHQRWK